jgi:hypothetical protein
LVKFYLINNIGKGLLEKYDGSVSNLIKKANNSCNELIKLILEIFLGFNDYSIYNGKQIFFLKRAQIFCADLYGSFGGESLGKFD